MVEVTPITSTNDLIRTKSYKSLFRKWFSCNNPIPSHYRHQVSAVEEEGTLEETSTRNNVAIQKFRSCEASFLRDINEVASPRCNLFKHKSLDKGFASIYAFPKNASIESNTAAKSSIHQIKVKIKGSEKEEKKSHDSVHDNTSTPKSTRRIVYSNSSGLLKPPPIEQDLQCSLEDLCFGCKKQMNLTRYASTHSGRIVEEEEAITINVKPGWRKGTRIKFEGKANDTLRAYQEDVIYYISEKKHELFAREGDDLELSLEISLVKALTGAAISVPLLGGEHMDLTLDGQIVYPGFQKIVTGLGMPISHDPEKRGNLIITFLVRFPTQLTHDQRSQVVNILQDSG